MHMRCVAVAVVAALAVAGPFRWAAGQARGAEAIVVGEFGSMTGSQATFGVSTDEGIKLAVAERNAAGGVLGRPVKLVLLDDAGKSQEAISAVSHLIEQDHAVADPGRGGVDAEHRRRAGGPAGGRADDLAQQHGRPGDADRGHDLAGVLHRQLPGHDRRQVRRRAAEADQGRHPVQQGPDVQHGAAGRLRPGVQEDGRNDRGRPQLRRRGQRLLGPADGHPGGRPAVRLHPRVLHGRGQHRPPGPADGDHGPVRRQRRVVVGPAEERRHGPGRVLLQRPLRQGGHPAGGQDSSRPSSARCSTARCPTAWPPAGTTRPTCCSTP